MGCKCCICVSSGANFHTHIRSKCVCDSVPGTCCVTTVCAELNTPSGDEATYANCAPNSGTEEWPAKLFQTSSR